VSQLAAFEVEGWTGPVTFIAGKGTIDDGRPVRLSVGVRHWSADAWVVVTSHRHDPDGLDRLRRWLPARLLGEATTAEHGARLMEAATSDRLVWEDTTISVLGAPVRFKRADLGGGRWVAIGPGEETDVTIEAAGVGHDDVRLIPYHEAIPPLLPAHAVAPADAPARPVRVDLTYRDARLVGMIGSQSVELDLEVPRSSGDARGRFAGAGLDVMWQLGDNYFTHPDIPGSLAGICAGQPVALNGIFVLDSDWSIDRATITGRYGDWTVDARLDGFSSQDVGITGSFGPTLFSVAATIAGDGRSGQVRGRVGGQAIRLDAGRRGQAIRVTGVGAGPPAFLAATIGALLYFI